MSKGRESNTTNAAGNAIAQRSATGRHDEHRASSATDDGLRNTAYQEIVDGAMAVTTDDDEVRPEPLGLMQHGCDRRTLRDERGRFSSATAQLKRQLLEPMMQFTGFLRNLITHSRGTSVVANKIGDGRQDVQEPESSPS